MKNRLYYIGEYTLKKQKQTQQQWKKPTILLTILPNTTAQRRRYFQILKKESYFLISQARYLEVANFNNFQRKEEELDCYYAIMTSEYQYYNEQIY
ncbi:hypothetical protein [Radiobacillus sp. PE A8.2]|uniref:hypothetical protein n=1 Tax=Radiobacillus sp. PE A8.2 TaxID=3380349 RepID=UPI003890D191